MNMQAIETTYNGVTFRSRLEARWALFFDRLGIEWLYENEGYETPHGRYVPDFWLPKVRMRSGKRGVLFEVKPSDYGDQHAQLEYVAERLHVGAILANGFNCDSGGWWEELYELAPMWDNCMMLYVCQCGTVKFEFSEGSYMECPACKRKDWNSSKDRIVEAYQYVRNYRFW